MSMTIFTSKKHKQTADRDDSRSDVEDDFTGKLSEADDSEDEEHRDSSDNSADLNAYQGESFDVEDIIDLNSKDLMLRKTITKKVSAPAASKKILVEEDWDM